jgi:hypothetical protein
MSDATETNGLETLAERLCAAYISAQMGFTSIDYVVKRYIRPLGKPPSDVWFQIAEFVSEVMTQAKPLPPDEPAKEAPPEASAGPAPIPIKGERRKRRSRNTPGAEK